MLPLTATEELTRRYHRAICCSR